MALEIALRAARVRYGPLEALHALDLPIARGALTVLLGPNGSGRSSALGALAGSVRLHGGHVEWYGGGDTPRVVTRMPAYRRATELGLTLLPATRAVFPDLDVAENLRLLGSPDGASSLFPELVPLRGRIAGTLSGGEQRMLALGCALTGPSRLLLLDEPGLGLAEEPLARARAAMADAVAAGRTVVVAEQTLPPGLAADLVYVLHRGNLAAAGEPGTLPLP
ncbi:ATP-binding cassette domain-containing protein [Streptacidiphilus monticola]|uniref:ATP-binding cassette domain-containing protein n=1 Tax=Streptacidiphilus monticola TaxID=2161674 RepID=A0ABW1FYQ6_9ACTN